MRRLPFYLFRGGSSKGAVLVGRHLRSLRASYVDPLLCAVMGSGQEMQIDGLGGGHGQTSKVVIVDKCVSEEADVTYTFAQVGVKERRVDHSHGDCLNMLTAVAPVAVEAGLVDSNGESAGGELEVRVKSMQTGLIARQTFHLCNGTIEYGSSGVEVCTWLMQPTGSTTGRLLPTGNPRDTLADGTAVSIVDFSRVVVFVSAEAVGMSCRESRQELAKQEELNSRLESIRREAALLAGLGDVTSKDSPKICAVAPPADASAAQLSARYWVNPGRCEPHGGLAITGASCLAAACLTPGTEAARLASGRGPSVLPSDDLIGDGGAHPQKIEHVFEHPGGTTSVLIDRGASGELLACGYRSSARLIAEGVCFPVVDDTQVTM